jgi:rhodanese-related sulfurtransferase
MPRILQRALVIVVTGAALGLAANAVSPRRISWLTPPPQAVPQSEFIPLPQAYQVWGGGTAFFLDARAPADYAAGHIANAFSLPAEEFDDRYPRVASLLTTDAVIICYCDGMECDLSHHLSDVLKAHGYTNVRILRNAWTDWTKAGYPTSKGTQP